MSAPRRTFGFLSNAWLVSASSLLAAIALGVLLWAPWDRPGIAGGGKLRLYCAVAMQKPVAEIIQEYQQLYGVTIEPTYGATGELLEAMKIAGGDLFLPADELTMELARKNNLVAEIIPVAVLRPVLVVNRQTRETLRREGHPVTSAHDLLRDDLKVVLANEDTTAIGQLTRRVLKPSGLWAEVERRRRGSASAISTAGTVSKVALSVRVGERYLGVVWDAVAAQFDDLEAIRVPEFEGVQEEVSIGVLKASKQPTSALQFARFLSAMDRGLEKFRQHHFTPVEGNDAWAERPHVAIAAGAMLMPAVADVIKEFEQREGASITTLYNGCGILVANMKAVKDGQRKEAFPDAYFACDQPFLGSVQQWFEPGVTLTANDVVLIVPKENPKRIISLKDLARPELRVGLAHPQKSALGPLTERLLKQHNVNPESMRAIVVHDAAAHELVNKMRIGALDAAVVYRSNAQSAPQNAQELKIIEIDDPDARAQQPFAIATHTQHPRFLERLRQALTARASVLRFQSLGFHWLHHAD